LGDDVPFFGGDNDRLTGDEEILFGDLLGDFAICTFFFCLCCFMRVNALLSAGS